MATFYCRHDTNQGLESTLFSILHYFSVVNFDTQSSLLCDNITIEILFVCSQLIKRTNEEEEWKKEKYSDAKSRKWHIEILDDQNTSKNVKCVHKNTRAYTNSHWHSLTHIRSHSLSSLGATGRRRQRHKLRDNCNKLKNHTQSHWH